MKKILIGIIIGLVISSTGIVVAYNLNSSDVSFTPENSEWEVSNVEEAVNDLYSMSDGSIELVAVFEKRIHQTTDVKLTSVFKNDDYVTINDNVATINKTGTYKVYYVSHRGYNGVNYYFDYVLNGNSRNLFTTNDTVSSTWNTISLDLNENDTIYFKGRLGKVNSVVGFSFAIIYYES